MSVRRLAPKEVQPASFTFTDENLAWAKREIAKYPPGRQASAVIAILWRVQEQHEGWVSEAAIRAVADLLEMPYIRALEVATFYTMFQLAPVGKKAHVQVCDGADRGFRHPAFMLLLHAPQDRDHRGRLATRRILFDLRFRPGEILFRERKARGLQFLRG